MKSLLPLFFGCFALSCFGGDVQTKFGAQVQTNYGAQVQTKSESSEEDITPAEGADQVADRPNLYDRQYEERRLRDPATENYGNENFYNQRMIYQNRRSVPQNVQHRPRQVQQNRNVNYDNGQ